MVTLSIGALVTLVVLFVVIGFFVGMSLRDPYTW